MNPETITKLQEVFAPVAEKIGQGAQFGWEVVVKQQIVSGIGSLIAVIFGLLLAIVSYKVSTKLWAFTRKRKSYEDGGDIVPDSDARFLSCVVGVLGGIVSSSLIFVNLYDAIAHFVNPAYYALDFFIHLAK